MQCHPRDQHRLITRVALHKTPTFKGDLQVRREHDRDKPSHSSTPFMPLARAEQ